MMSCGGSPFTARYLETYMSLPGSEGPTSRHHWLVAPVTGAPFIFAGAILLVAEHLGEPTDHHNAITRA